MKLHPDIIRKFGAWVGIFARIEKLRNAPGMLVKLLLAGFLAASSSPAAGAAPLITLQYHITSTSLQVTPTTLVVPKGIPGSVLVSVLSGGSTNTPAAVQLSTGAYVQAILKGPAFPQPYVVSGPPNQPLILPPINLVGSYELDNIQLVDAVTGAVRMEGSPASVPVQVFANVLVSQVTSTPLTLDQIQQLGIDIDQQDFSAIQFDISFTVNGETIPISLPVVSPRFTQSTELIPADQLQAQLAVAAAINQQLSTTVHLPPQLSLPQLNFQVQGINFQPVDQDGNGLSLQLPPIPAIMVIPGNIGFLDQFFSVQIFTQNGSPQGSGLVVSNCQAMLNLPVGPSGIPVTNVDYPGDAPLTYARIGPHDVIEPVQTIVKPGPDGQLSDGSPLLNPGDTGQAEFLVVGMQEGTWLMNINLTAQLYGLETGPVTVTGQAAGSVLVQNPKFSISFTVPSVVRSGNPFQASATLFNTGTTPANLVSISLNSNSLSGVVFAPGQGETYQINTLQPGQSFTVTYNLISEETGAVGFTDISTSSDHLTGQFNLSLAVDQRGVALSPNSLALPNAVNLLPPQVLAAANAVLGQALGVSTAAQLPAGVLPIQSATVTERALELAEAGQRLQYGDPLKRVLPDLLRDWQGGRVPDAGFDQLVRQTGAGGQWAAALFGAMETNDLLTGVGRVFDRAADLAGLDQQFVIAAANPGQLRADFTASSNNSVASSSSQPYALIYPGTNGVWAVTQDEPDAVFTWSFTNGPATGDMAVLIVNSNGFAQSYHWTVPNPPTTALYHFALNDPTMSLQVDNNGDGTIESTLPATQGTVNELPPTLIAVQQDLTVNAGRPGNPCIGPDYLNYGTVVAVVYSKPVNQAGAGTPSSYTLDGNNGADSAQIQPNGRVALINLYKGISDIIPRTLTITNVTDPHGNLLAGGVSSVLCRDPDNGEQPLKNGVAIVGRVLHSDGTSAPGIPVTLTMNDRVNDGQCDLFVVRVSQALTDTNGNFNFDYVVAGIPYTISATDTGGLSSNALAIVEQATIGQGPDQGLLMAAASASPAAQEQLLELFDVGSLDQAVIVVQGLQRVVLNDFVGLHSSRLGQTVPFALRFRGQGTVEGQIVAADGVTAVQNAAVNLFPDPTSLIQPSGVYSDVNGDFSFVGVPLGPFSMSVATSDGRQAQIVGIISTPSQTTNITIALPNVATPVGTLAGEVFDADNLTPNGNGTVYIGKYGGSTVSQVIAVVPVDANGFWTATNLPVKPWDIVAITADQSTIGTRTGITPVANQVTYANITLQAATVVYGRVQFADGRPAPGAVVAGGIALVTADTNGNFTLQGVPVGSATISAGLAPSASLGVDFPRLGSANLNVIEGQDNYVVVNLNAAGRLYGRVLDAQGNPVGGVEVAIPEPDAGGFLYTTADGNGNYSFDDLGLGSYVVSAPANATEAQLNVPALDAMLASGDQQQILLAMQQALNVYSGAADPNLTGLEASFSPEEWGYSSGTLAFDGQSVDVDIHYLPIGSISGTVVNSQGIPISAIVQLTGFGPDSFGDPSMTVRGTTISDPATGQFIFTNDLFIGNWQLEAASPFYPEVIQTNGFTDFLQPDVTGVVLRFPEQQDVKGVIAGHVYYPDGSLVGAGVQVHISLASTYQIQTDTNGIYNTQIQVPEGGYSIQVFDPVTGLQGQGGVQVRPGITNWADIHLLSRNSTVTVRVMQGNGQPAVDADVELDSGSFPYPAPVYLNTDTNGLVTFNGLWEGSYAAMTEFAEDSTLFFARAGGSVGANQTLSLTLQLGASGSVQGTFVATDGLTPIYGAEVAIGNLGYATTDTNGFFEFDGVPLGTYTITSMDPVTGGNAETTATITSQGQVTTVELVEATLGTINGVVIDSYGTGVAAGAIVTANFSSSFTPNRTVTTDPSGSFSLPGSPMGQFNLSATYTLPDGSGVRVAGSGSGSLSPSTPNANVQIRLQSVGSLPVRVVRSDGITPATNATVYLSGAGSSQQQDTDPNGQAVFSDLLVGRSCTVAAYSRIGGDLNDAVEESDSIAVAGTNSPVVLELPGVGAVQGKLFASDGVAPESDGLIILTFQGGLFAGNQIYALAGSQGQFDFVDVPVGPYRLTAESISLAASRSDTIPGPGVTNTDNLILGASGTIEGYAFRPDDVTPVTNVAMVITYASQSANPGIAYFFTSTNGYFEFDDVPIGSVHLAAADVATGGIISTNVVLASNGEDLNLGIVLFDETVPAVTNVIPANDTIGVPITNSVQLVFNEAMDPATIQSDGIFIEGTNGIIDSALTLLPDSNGVRRIVNLVPASPLQSLSTYEVVVLSGQLSLPDGTIGSGPQDLVGRNTDAPFTSEFTTADNTPPVLLSSFPSNNAVQIDPASVPRLAFSKILRPSGFYFLMFDANGNPVSGTASIGVEGEVLNFLPAADLQPNSTYTMVISNVFDLAGNRAVGDPYTATFATLRTIGPAITNLQIVTGQKPLGGTTVQVVATLNTTEAGATVNFSRDFTPIGIATNRPFAANVPLPSSGSTTVRAVALDKYGTEGQVASLRITVEQGTPPAVQITQLSPPSGPVPSGSSLAVSVLARAESAVAQISTIISGAANGSLVVSNFAVIPLPPTNTAVLIAQGSVPATAIAGQLVVVYAQAVDNAGLVSGQQTLTVPVSDGTPPAIAIVSPGTNAFLLPGQPLTLAVQVSDNSSNVSLALAITGTISTNQSIPVALLPNTPQTNIFIIQLSNAPPTGGQIIATVTATDLAGNSSVTSRSFRLPETITASVQSISPTNGQINVAVAPAVAVTFNEAMNPATINSNSFQVFLGAIPIPGAYSFSPDDSTVSWSPSAPLIFGSNYTVALTAAVSDLYSNAIAPQITSFTVTGFQITQPVNNAHFIEGQQVALNASGANPAGINAVAYSIFGTNVATASAPGFSASFTVPLLANLPTNYLTISASAEVAGYATAQSPALQPVSIEILPPAFPAAEMQIQFPNSIQVVDGIASDFAVSVSATNGNLNLLRVVDPAAAFQTLEFSQSGAPIITNAPGSTNLAATLVVLHNATNAEQILLVAQDDFGLTVTQAVTVSSLPPLSPVISGEPANQIVLAGGNALFSVTSGGSSLAYQWLHQGTNLLDGGNVSGATAATLSVTNVSDADNGGYFVIISNLQAAVTSSVALLVVLDPAPAAQTNTYWYERAVNNNWNQSGPPGNWIDANFLEGTPYVPNGTNYNVFLEGLGGAPASLDLSLALNSLTIENSGGLNLSGASLSANRFDLQGDMGISGSGSINNPGLFLKSAGSNTCIIAPDFNNVGGAIQVASGQLTLAAGSTISGAAFDVAAGATLDPINGQSVNWSGAVSGSGAGQVLFGGGSINANPSLTLSLPAGMFQWSGGSVSGTMTNLGAIHLSGADQIFGQSSFFNAGLVEATGSGSLNFSGNSSIGTFENLPGSTYQFDNDSSVSVLSGINNASFINQGLVWKSAGTNTSAITASFSNEGGSIEVDSGKLSLAASSYVQGNGTLTVLLGGTNSGQCGQLASTGSASLSGPFVAGIANGFEAAQDSQFQVLACSSLSGTFSTVNVPARFSLSYSNNGVFLTATSLAPFQITTVFTTNVTIDTTNLAFDGQNIILSNCILTVVGPHEFNSLDIISNATVTCPAASTGQTNNRIDLTISGSVVVDTTSRISADGLGYSAGGGAGSGIRESWAAGGGYGGLGGTINANGGGVYGSLAQPTDLGSGGSDAGSSGGGAIELAVGGSLLVNGLISADGVTGGYSGGSGGSIWLQSSTLSGSGTIQANGAYGNNNGGGGGRIAIDSQAINNFAGSLTAFGGTASAGSDGGAGTIYLQTASNPTASVIVDNDGNEGAYTPFNFFGVTNLNVLVTNRSQISLGGGQTWNVNSLIVASNCAISCFSTNAGGQLSNQWAGAGITIQAQTVTIEEGAEIIADGLGYTAGNGPGAGIRESWGAGGGYGGLGGTVNSTGGGAYGSLTEPTDLGSGGSDAGSSGGGAIDLEVAGMLQINGAISANGVTGGYSGGSGGSIWLQAGTLSGSGSIQANGAYGNNNGGGGGRIAVVCQLANNFAGSVTAFGGTASAGSVGGAGTIYLQTASNPTSSVILDNDGKEGTYTPASFFNTTNLNVLVTNRCQIFLSSGQSWNLNSLVVASNCAISCFSANTSGQVSNQWVGAGITIHAQTITINETAEIIADGLGYAAGNGPGAGIRESWGAGGGYGGLGGTVNSTGGGAYGSLAQPTDLGSGGSDEGSSGGGAIELVAGTLQIDGIISANGDTGGYSGGSGGSIWLQAGTLSGSGTIQANGAFGNNNGGGGGRIAIVSQVINSFVGNVTAFGGTASAGSAGGAGTIYLETASNPTASVVVDNDGNEGAYTPASFFDATNLNVLVRNSSQISLSGGQSWNLNSLVVASNCAISCFSTNASSQISNQWVGAGITIQAQTITINENAEVIADALGYTAGNGPGAGMRESWGAGGGYGGLGGTVNASGGGAYGSLTQPTDLGSGGSDGGSSGGGAIELVAGALEINGSIRANGVTGGYSGGSGGSIWLQAGTLSGSGSIQANGAYGNNNGGGGGRIAVVCQLANNFAGSVTAFGGTASAGSAGGAGTIYFQTDSNPTASVILDNHGNQGNYTPASFIEGTNLAVLVTNNTQISLGGGQTWTLNSLVVASNSALWCFGSNYSGQVNNEWAGTGVVIQAQSVIIKQGGEIIADGQGYTAGDGPGAGIRESWAAGGGYGGVGGTQNATGGGTYGSMTQPTDLGSGGSDGGSSGGGAVQMIVLGNLQINGLLSADGLTGGFSGGSGGSLWLQAGTLAGSGTIQADGAYGNNNGGGGGRIAIYSASPIPLASSQITATGGANNGQPGTVYIAVQPLVITRISIVPGTRSEIAVATTPGLSVRSIILTCKSLSGQNLVVEGSSDLVHWSKVSAVTLEIQPGVYQATLQTTLGARGFYRLCLQTSP